VIWKNGFRDVLVTHILKKKRYSKTKNRKSHQAISHQEISSGYSNRPIFRKDFPKDHFSETGVEIITLTLKLQINAKLSPKI